MNMCERAGHLLHACATSHAARTREAAAGSCITCSLSGCSMQLDDQVPRLSAGEGRDAGLLRGRLLVLVGHARAGSQAEQPYMML